MGAVCVACGMPMTKAEDFATGDETKDYCRYCAREDGSMRSYDEAVAGMTAFMVQTQGLEESAAREAAIAHLAKQPAWQRRG